MNKVITLSIFAVYATLKIDAHWRFNSRNVNRYLNKWDFAVIYKYIIRQKPTTDINYHLSNRVPSLTEQHNVSSLDCKKWKWKYEIVHIWRDQQSVITRLLFHYSIRENKSLRQVILLYLLFTPRSIDIKQLVFWVYSTLMLSLWSKEWKFKQD